MYSYEELIGTRWLAEELVKLYSEIFGTWEKREKAKNIFCWCLIIFITLTPYISKQKSTVKINIRHDNSVYEEIVDTEVIDTTKDIHDVIFKAVRDWLPEYTLYKTTIRDDRLYVRLYNKNGYNYNDLVKLGNYLKSAYSECKIYIIFVKYWDLEYAITDYRI